jgi:hypothetical protein
LEIDAITMVPISEYQDTDKFVQLDCGHVFEYTGIDQWLQTCVDGAGTGAVRLPQCPSCKAPVRCTMRYGAVIKKTLAQIEQVKPLLLFKQDFEQAQRLFDAKQFIPCLTPALRSLKSFPTPATAQLYVQAAQSADVRPDASARLSELPSANIQPVLLTAQALLLMGVGSKSSESLQAAAQLLIPKINASSSDATLDQCVFLAYGAYMLKQVDNAQGILDKILQARPSFKPAVELKKDIIAMKEVVSLISKTDHIQPGGWYACRNGHLFAIGECGGAMERSKCPDCGAVVGGANHALDASNSHVGVDGSRHAAWGDAANMANFNLDEL